MQIDPIAPTARVNPGDGPAPVGLDQRVGAQHRPDPAHDAFYVALQKWQDSGHATVHAFLKAYATDSGEKPYRSIGTQMEILQIALKRLKDEGHADSALYKETYAAFATVFGSKAFITQFAQEVFDPQALADQEEDSAW